MNAVRVILGTVDLNRVFLLCWVYGKAWHYTPDPETCRRTPKCRRIQKIGPARPTCGTRRMAAQIFRELNHPVNCKAIRRIFKRLGWAKPSRTKREIIRANKNSRGQRRRIGSGSLTCPISGADPTVGVIASTR